MSGNTTKRYPAELEARVVRMVAERPSAEWVYVAFVIDAYARRIVGWSVSTSMTTDFVLHAFEQAVWTRNRYGTADFTHVVHHNDRGSQYTSIRSINGLYKTELIKSRNPCKGVDTSKSRPLNGSTGSTTAGSTSTAATSHQLNWRRPTTLDSQPNNQLR